MRHELLLSVARESDDYSSKAGEKILTDKEKYLASSMAAFSN